MQSGLPNKPPMAELVPITREDRLPSLFDREADRDIPDRVVMGTGSDGELELRRPLTDAERSVLERRANELSSALAPWPTTNRDVLEGEVSLMLNVPANRSLDERAAMGFVAQYLQLTRDKPHWAIVKVCRLVRLGKTGLAPGYCLTEAEFNQLLEREVAAYQQQLIRTRRILNAKALPSPAPKLTRAEIEAKLGHPLGAPAPPEAKASDGNHVARVVADIAARKALREEERKNLIG